MLILKRKIDESVVIDGGRIVVKLLGIKNGIAQIGFQALPDVIIDRDEVHLERVRQKEKESQKS